MKRKLAASLSIAFLSLSGAVGPAAAQDRRQDYVVVWYTDESETTISGQRIAFCDGGSFRIGTPTLYEETIYYGCG